MQEKQTRAQYGSVKKSPSQNVLPNHIKELRIANGYLTQKQFAVAMGVSEATICYWETGSFFPTTQNIRKLCSTLNCTVDELFDWDA
ncbi:MAG: helix-turn-helix transcriptional regulator [Candidatus Pacebacteria bacterium]|nr:helix-turn-helix transcriptional regulator [Candidatus Paceibacterota bacterium]